MTKPSSGDNPANQNRPRDSADRLDRAIYVAAFFAALSLGVWFIAMPFIVVKHLKGSDADAGLCTGLHMASYMVGCVVTGPVLHRFDNRRLIQLGVGCMAFFMGVMIAVIGLHTLGVWQGETVSLLIGVCGLSGLTMAVVWPCMAGLLSTGHEGARLNRRFGLFNVSWSFATFLGPLLGGLLIRIGPIWPLLVAGLSLTVTFAAISAVRGGSGAVSETGRAKQDAPRANGPEASLIRFRWTARIALLTSFFCVGVIRNYLPLLLHLDLNQPEPVCGLVIATFSFANFVMYFTAGRIAAWHYNLPIFGLAQLLILISVLIISQSFALPIFILLIVIFGLAQAFVYASHAFYGVSGGKKRSGLMAIHELVIGAGMSSGFLAGGVLSDHFGRRAPYLFCGAVVLLGLIVQMIVWFRIGRPQREHPPPPAANGP